MDFRLSYTRVQYRTRRRMQMQCRASASGGEAAGGQCRENGEVVAAAETPSSSTGGLLVFGGS
jgi:hypothetical protein